jgi:hypothetical protein
MTAMSLRSLSDHTAGSVADTGARVLASRWRRVFP